MGRYVEILYRKTMRGSTQSSNSEFATKESPKYSVMSSDMGTSLSVATALFAATVATMFVFADTVVGELVLAMYSWYPIVGVAVMGVGLVAGRHFGMTGFTSDDTALSVAGCGITILTYGAFGGSVLTPYDPSLYIPATLIAAAITLAIALVAGAYVYTRDQSFAHWSKYSMFFFLGGLGAIFIGSFVPGSIGALLLLGGFLCFLIGFTVDLVYEIWHMSSANRTPTANGFGLYIAFTGIFVHILQLVLRAMADK